MQDFLLLSPHCRDGWSSYYLIALKCLVHDGMAIVLKGGLFVASWLPKQLHSRRLSSDNWPWKGTIRGTLCSTESVDRGHLNCKVTEQDGRNLLLKEGWLCRDAGADRNCELIEKRFVQFGIVRALLAIFGCRNHERLFLLRRLPFIVFLLHVSYAHFSELSTSFNVDVVDILKNTFICQRYVSICLCFPS